ncbi:MAG: N-acetyltransferase [Actinobacteria bacterium]|nr:N-acetyltransferase [Actinomycetota bacterium]
MKDKHIRRVKLRSVMREDYESLFEWVNDRETRIQSGAFKPVSWIEHVEWIERTLRATDSELLIIANQEDGSAIGHLLLTEISKVHRSCSLFIRIGTEALRNKGIGTEAMGLFLEYAWRDLGLNRVQLTVRTDNLRAKKSYLKSGFRVEGVMRDAVFIDGEFRDLELLAVLRSDTDIVR